MSSPIASDTTLENLIHCLTNQRLSMVGTTYGRSRPDRSTDLLSSPFLPRLQGIEGKVAVSLCYT